MCSVASHEYNSTNPDEVRIAPNAFDELLGHNPWQIIAK